MTEQLFLAAFIFIFGAQVGRVLTLHQQYRKTVEGITCLLNAEWLPPQSMAAQLIHEDQEALPPVGPLRLTITQQCRMIHSSVRAR